MKKVIILLILLLVTSVSGCQKKYSHHPTAIGPGVEMNGSLELKEDEYLIFHYANYMYAQPGLKFVEIDGVMPNNETIQKCEYPYVNDFYVVIRKDEDENSNACKIFDWMTSLEAQKLLSEAGYVPVVDVGQ